MSEQMAGPDEICQTIDRRFLFWKWKQELKHDLFIKSEMPLITRTITTLGCKRCGKEATCW